MANPKQSIAVLGAGGRLGSEAVRAFHGAGWQVRAVTRRGDGSFARGVETVAADARDEASLVAATRGARFIFNGLNPKYTDWQRSVPAMARNVVAAAHVNDSVHLFPGNVYNFGSSIPAAVTEETPERPDHRKARIRAEAERLFADAATGLGVRTLVLRAGDFFGGPGRGSWFDLIVAPAVGRGKVTYPGPTGIVHAWAYLPDLAAAFVRLAAEADGLSRFEKFHFGGHNVTGAEMHGAIERATGRRMRLAGFPWPLLKIGGLAYPMWREVGEVSYLWHRAHAMEGARLETVTGPLVRTPLDMAVRESLAAMGIAVQTPTRADRNAMASMAA